MKKLTARSNEFSVPTPISLHPLVGFGVGTYGLGRAVLHSGERSYPELVILLPRPF